MPASLSPDLARTTSQLLALSALIASSFWIVRPFLVSLTWAIMMQIARINGVRDIVASCQTLARPPQFPGY